MEEFSLRDRVAVVTGGGQSLGLAISRVLRGAGAEMVIAEVNDQTGPDVAEELEGTFVHTDVTDPASVRDMVEMVLDELGRIDVLVNNAGIVHNIPSEEVPDEEWLAVISVNLTGVFWCCREVGKTMLERGTGSIVNIASMSGIISNHPQPQAAYNASKAAVHQLTRSLAAEWAPYNVRVNALAPGYVRTAMSPVDEPQFRRHWIEDVPMRRYATPDELGPSIVYLASDASSFMTGSILVVDGGYTLF